jgi:two-component system KDP operon response regulator KdpE
MIDLIDQRFHRDEAAPAHAGARVLVIDDEPEIGRAVRLGLSGEGYSIEWASTAHEGIERATHRHPDVMILDLSLPDLDGIAVCQQLRAWSRVPIIVLSIRGSDKDKIAALDSGADDYLTKPFSLGELQARVRVALRHAAHGSGASTAQYQVGDLVLDFMRRRVIVRGEAVHLRPTEYEVLKYLAQHAGQVVTHAVLLRAVWGVPYEDQTNYLRVCVTHVRRAIEADPSHPYYLLTEVGIGYRLRPPDETLSVG